VSKNRKLYSTKVLSIIFVFSLFIPRSTYSANLTNASLTLGDSRPSANSTYTLSASSLTTSTAINCIQIELDIQADGLGATPQNIDTTNSSLDSSSIITTGSWTVDNSTNGLLKITNAGGENPNSNGNIVFGDIVNGDTEGTYYAIISSYANLDCSSGGPIDTAAVAFSYLEGEEVELEIGLTLTFLCSNVGSGENINGSTTTHASTASGIDFGRDVTSGTNGISAHDISVTTNASGGYVVYIRHSGPLSASLSTIDNHAGNNASPTAFPAPGTEAWGYSTDDSDLTGGVTDRFTNPGNSWAGFNTVNEPVVYNVSAVPSTETTRVGQQVGISTNTSAGSYQTSIIYTLVAIF